MAAGSEPEYDLYEVLEVSPRASTETILAAHRSMVSRYHPDVSRSPEAIQMTKRLNVARDWLTDPEKRRAYDASRASTPRAAATRSAPSAARQPPGSGP